MKLPSFAAFDDASTTASSLAASDLPSRNHQIPHSIMADAEEVEADEILSLTTTDAHTTPPYVLQRYSHIMNNKNLEPFLYRDNYVDASNKAVIKHLVEDFKDHVSADFCPGVKWNDNHINFSYSIDGNEIRSKYFAIDGIYLDLLKTSGVHDGGLSNVRLILPNTVLNKLKGGMPLRAVNGCWVTMSESKMDDDLSFVNAEVDSKNPPAFIRVHTQLDRNSQATRATKESMGILSTSIEPHVYKICGFFTLSLLPNSCKAVLTMVGVHAFDINDALVKKNKLVNATAFGV